MSEMTLERAAEVLTKHRLGMYGDFRGTWVVEPAGLKLPGAAFCPDSYSAFEAIAIAEKLERDSGDKTETGPEPVYEINSPEVLAAHACDKALRGLDIHQKRNVMAFLNSIPFDPKAV